MHSLVKKEIAELQKGANAAVRGTARCCVRSPASRQRLTASRRARSLPGAPRPAAGCAPQHGGCTIAQHGNLPLQQRVHGDR